MIFKHITQKTILAGLVLAVCGTLNAQDVTISVPEVVIHIPEVASNVPAAFTYIPYGESAYTETLAKRPGTCLLTVLGLISAKLAYDKYKDYHNTRAKTRSQLWKKIQHECYTFSANGVSTPAKVRDFSDVNIANALLKKRNDWLADARGISNWGVLQDKRLIALVEEFFVALKNTSANIETAIPAQSAPWWKFWVTSRGQRLIPNILSDIEECLMGSVG